MEMCYDGALVMPQNFSVVTADEMTYVEGGGLLQSVAYYAVKIGIDAGLNAWMGGGTIRLIRDLSGVAKDKFKEALWDAVFNWTIARVANYIVGTWFTLFSSVALSSVGTVLANWFDKTDGAADHQIYFTRVYSNLFG